MKLSALICTMNRPSELCRCIDSLVAQTRPPDEAIIVDASDTDAAKRALRNALAESSVGLVYRRSAPGAAMQRNLGLEAVAGDIVFFLDDDIVLEPDCVERLASAFESDEAGKLAGVSPMLRHETPMPRRMRWVRRLFLLPHSGADGRLMASGHAAWPWDGETKTPTRIEVACGCSAWRKSLLELEQFDPYFVGYSYMEDLDLSLRMRRHGDILLEPEAVAWHLEAPSGRPDVRALSKMQGVNHNYLFRKHLPQYLRHRLAYAWAVLGDGLLKAALGLRTGDWGSFRGWLDARNALWRGERG